MRPLRAHQPRGRRWSSRDEGGYIMPMTALLLVPLLIMVGFSVDVGFWYSKAAKMQRAADAAALAGVVWMPGDVGRAQSVARATAAKNGFDHGVGGITVDVQPVTGKPQQLTVSIRDPAVRGFFTRMVVDSISLVRRATARYVLPVPLGSPLNTFGNQNVPPSAADPQFWAAIQAPYSRKEDGDPRATRCLLTTGTGSACTTANSEYRDSGYLYGIDVPQSAVGSTLTVEVFDAGFYHRGLTVETGDSRLTGAGAGVGANVQYELFEADTSQFDNTDNPTLAGRCGGGGPGRLTLPNGTVGYRNNWTVVCRIPVTQAGVFPLRVTTLGTGNATAQYSLRATTSGVSQPRLYGIGDMSILTNVSGSTATFHLVEVTEVHAGKTLEIDLFDPGDGNTGDYFLSILKPGAAVASCRFAAGGGPATNADPCRIQTRVASLSPPNRYNNQWLRISIDLPSDYVCGADCWWKIRYEFGGQPTDRTTWSAGIVGAPVQLVE